VVSRLRRRDGTRYYRLDRYCRDHDRARDRAWLDTVPAIQKRRARRAARVRARQEKARQQAAHAQERMRRKEACIAFVRRYVAGLWEHEPAWMLTPDRAPDRVEARALVAAILYREHGLGITETSRCIGRDHSTALHLLRTFEPRPEFQELLAEYRHMRQQRRAARGRKAG
jgi:hypothetical protein